MGYATELFNLRKIISCFLLLSLVFVGVSCDNQSKEQILHDGLQFSKAGNYRGAIVFFKKALDKEPNYFTARFHLADSYLQVGKYDQSEKEFSKVAHQSPAYPQLSLKLAELYVRTSRTDRAITDLNSYITKNPEDGAAYDVLGRAYAVKKDFPAAKKSFRKAIQFDSKNPVPKLHLAQLLIQLEEDEFARQLLEDILAGDEKNMAAYYLIAGLERSLGNRDKAISLYLELSKYYPDAVKSIYLTGILMLDKGSLDEVEKIASDLKTRFPKRPEGTRLNGLLLYTKKDYVGAEVELLSSLKLGLDLTSFYFHGLTYYKLNKLELALNQFQKAVDIKPSFVQARVMVGMTLLKQKRLDDAINEIHKALKWKEDNGLAHNVLGSAYLGKGMYDEAMAEFDRAIEINPNLVDAHLKKGLFSFSKGDSKKAEEELEKALSVAPEVMNTRLLLSSFYIRQQNYSAAIRTMQEGLTGKSGDALLYNYMAAAWFAQKKPEEALIALNKAKEIKPDYFTPYFNIAAYYSSKADYDKAIAEYQEILKIDQENLQALLTAAALYELKGDDTSARNYFINASMTKDPRAFLALSQYYLRAKKYDEAPKTLDAALQLYPSNPAILEMKGRLLVDNGATAEAASIFKDLEKVKPGRGIPLLVKAYLKDGETGKAVTLAKKIINNNPKRSYGYLLLSDIYISEKNYTASEQVLRDGLKNSTQKDLVLKMRLGNVQERMGNHELAGKIYKEMEKKYPDNSQVAFALASLSDRSGNKREALKLYQEILDKDKNNAPSLNNLAYLYAENYSDPEKALELAMQAYRKKPNSPEVMDTLGYVLLQNGKSEQAFKLLKKANAMLSNNPTVNYHLAMAYQAQNQFDPASKLLKQALEKGEFPEKEAAQKLLIEINKE